MGVSDVLHDEQKKEFQMRLLFQITIVPAIFLSACQSIQPTDISSTSIPKELTPRVTEMPVLTQATIVSSSPVATIGEENVKTIELPEWVRTSWNDILLLAYQDDPMSRPSKAIFVNPESGDKSIIDLPGEFYYYYWKDAEHIVFFQEGNCDESPGFISVLDIPNGVLQKYTSKNYPEYVQDCYPHDLGEELTRINPELAERTVEFVDPSTGEISLLTNPNDGVADISDEVSPEKNYVAIVQYRGKFEMPGLWQPLYGNQISIYDLRTRKLVLQFVEEQGILSEVSFVNYHNLVYMRKNTPCLVMIDSLVKKCIHNIPQQFHDATVILGEPQYEIGRIGFLYFSFYPQHHGGYCFYSIYSGGVDCPTDRFPSLEDQIVINHSLSPDEHYLLIEYDHKGCPMPYCDYFDVPQLAVIDLDNDQLFEIGPTNLLFSNIFRPIQPNPWRP